MNEDVNLPNRAGQAAGRRRRGRKQGDRPSDVPRRCCPDRRRLQPLGALVDHIEDIKVERARHWSIGTPFARVCEAEALFLARLVLSAADGCAMSCPPLG